MVIFGFCQHSMGKFLYIVFILPSLTAQFQSTQLVLFSLVHFGLSYWLRFIAKNPCRLLWNDAISTRITLFSCYPNVPWVWMNVTASWVPEGWQHVRATACDHVLGTRPTRYICLCEGTKDETQYLPSYYQVTESSSRQIESGPDLHIPHWSPSNYL